MYSKIAFDIDGIVFDTGPQVLRKYNQIHGTNFQVEDWTSYYFEESFGHSEELILQAFEELVASEEIPFMRGAVRGLRTFYERVQEPLVFVTSRGEPQAAVAKEQIEKAIKAPVVVYSEKDRETQPRKMSTLQKLKVRFFIEDNPTHWQDYMSNGMLIGTFILPWTKSSILEMEDVCEVSLFPFLHWDHLQPFIVQLVDLIDK